LEIKHIHPIFDSILPQKAKEDLLKQNGFVIWMTGLSGSGKSTLAKGMENEFHQKGVLSKLLDGDNLRSGLNNNLGFSEADRLENIRRTAEVCKLFAQTGILTIASFVSPTLEIRQLARQIIGEDFFYEVYVNCPFDICAQRDVKGLYKKALNGEIKNFTGLDAPFEAPEKPFLELRTHEKSLDECLESLMNTFWPISQKNYVSHF
jgi:adenylylsulfate kinase